MSLVDHRVHRMSDNSLTGSSNEHEPNDAIPFARISEISSSAMDFPRYEIPFWPKLNSLRDSSSSSSRMAPSSAPVVANAAAVRTFRKPYIVPFGLAGS